MTAVDLQAWSAASEADRQQWEDDRLLGELIAERKREIARG